MSMCEVERTGKIIAAIAFWVGFLCRADLGSNDASNVGVRQEGKEH